MSRNETFVENFASLDNLVLVVFSNDTIVTPKESGWFESYEIVGLQADTDPESDDHTDADFNLESIRAPTPPLVSMYDQPLYREDWIGLRTLDERGAVVRLTCVGEHMHISDECWRPLVEKYVGGVPGSSESRSPLMVHAS